MKKIYKNYILYFFGFILFILLLGIFDFYFFGNKIFLGKFTSSFISYPVISVNGDIITYKQYNTFISDFDVYYPDLKKDKSTISKILIQKKILDQEIEKMNININNDDFKIFVNNFYKKNNIFQKEISYLEENYNWNKDKFENYIIKPLYLENLIADVVKSDDFNRENKIKIEEIYGDLIKNPDKFEEYATIYKDNALFNEIGWMPYRDLPAGLSSKIDKLEVNGFTNISKSLSGYHIYKLKGKVKIEDGDEYYYKLIQIFIPIKNVNLYLDDAIKNSKIIYFLKF